MADNVILFAGPMGAGKTTAIRSVSEIPVVSTEAENNERNISDKPTTTVALDYGEILLSDDEKVRLYGLPGQKRFDFMWRILVERAMGMVLLIDNAAPDPVAVLFEYVSEFESLARVGAMVVGVSRMDLAPEPTIAHLSERLAEERSDLVLPVLPVDPREGSQVRLALMALIANVEMGAHRLSADRDAR
jgi:signal recognition particle receptor subunit beta